MAKTQEQYANEQQHIRMDRERQVEPIVTAQKEVEMFRSSEYCTRYEYVSVDLQKPVVTPDKNAFQSKTGYRLFLMNEAHPFDWYNG